MGIICIAESTAINILTFQQERTAIELALESIRAVARGAELQLSEALETRNKVAETLVTASVSRVAVMLEDLLATLKYDAGS